MTRVMTYNYVLRMPEEWKALVRVAAAEEGLSLNVYMCRVIENALYDYVEEKKRREKPVVKYHTAE